MNTHRQTVSYFAWTGFSDWGCTLWQCWPAGYLLGSQSTFNFVWLSLFYIHIKSMTLAAHLAKKQQIPQFVFWTLGLQVTCALKEDSDLYWTVNCRPFKIPAVTLDVKLKLKLAIIWQIIGFLCEQILGYCLCFLKVEFRVILACQIGF